MGYGFDDTQKITLLTGKGSDEMADVNKVNKVIEGLDCHAKNKVCMNHCPYCDGTGSDKSCTKQLATDSIELLKEQNSLMLALDQSNSANEYLNEEVDKLNALLRQQQDEIAMLTKKAKSPTWRRGKAFCGSCGGCLENKEKHSADIVSSIRFCKWCGTPVDWSNE